MLKQLTSHRALSLHIKLLQKEPRARYKTYTKAEIMQKLFASNISLSTLAVRYPALAEMIDPRDNKFKHNVEHNSPLCSTHTSLLQRAIAGRARCGLQESSQ
jgi:hypothetical protein